MQEIIVQKEDALVIMFDRITFGPKIMGDRACIRGMRIPVSVIVGQVAHGATVEEILADYPDLETRGYPSGARICSRAYPGRSFYSISE